MSKVQLRALKPQRYGTRHLEAGDLFEAEPKQVRILTAIKRAELVEGATPASPAVTRYATRQVPEAKPPGAMTTQQMPMPRPEPKPALAPAPEPEPELVDEVNEDEFEESAETSTEYDEMTRGELLAEVRQRGLKLPAGYVSQPALVALLRDASV